MVIMTAERLLTTDQVARRLGVKKATVYAYVSRGLLSSRRHADGKESLFAAAEVENFAGGRRRGDEAPATHTGITLITGGDLYYRGRDARLLAGSEQYEAVAGLLWTGDLRAIPLVPDPGLRGLAEQVTAPLPPSARLTDRLRLIVAAASAADPLRFDTTPAGVVATGRTLLGTMVAALPARSADQTGETFACLLWRRLTAAAPADESVAVLNAALILLADHDLAASTLAARVAASTRAHPYAVVSAGLAAFDGPLHGAASGLVHQLLTDATASGDPVATISERLRAGEAVPGFGHPLYPDGDPRATTLLALLSDLPPVATELAEAMLRRSGVAPNIDFAIAALALRHGMARDAGEAIFAVARTAGWIAHALEEYGDRPSRFRPSGRYAGRLP
jgi:citrate synthase